MTKEEIVEKMNNPQVLGYNREVPIEAIRPGSELPGGDIACYIIKGKSMWYGSYENKEFKHITVTNGLIDKCMETVDEPDWWIPFDSVKHVPTPRKKIITIDELFERLRNYPGNTEVVIGDCKFKEFYYDKDEECLNIE